ncbi:hypothetical protein, conserved [Eimeria tenella]|uniref:Uncharacterized protein n=1 Tax=Eimeria tenella TaxID=5802 RepID=U6KUK8_EIMTE|nr:hypothetical protein, conserved [Eimeria tenella]CDJ40034.1 hypothetical protein, conserved [Eimeria tenella]|eukprot:XP_013230787.1 hypothetical protein, conserved [Eimeria tenella]
MELLRPRGAAAPAAAGGPPATRPLRRSGIKRRMLIPIQKFSSNTARQGAEDLVSLKDIECGGGEAPSGDETTPRRLPQTLQDTAANRLAVASLALNRGIQCERGSSQDTIVELGSSRGPAVAEMLPPAHRRIFYSILTHGADDARSGNRERPERSPSNEMVEARGVAEGDENPDSKRKENPDVKASHVILAAQNKGSRESLTLCPLRYTDKSMEKEFAYNQERTARFRNVLAGLFASFLVVVDIILYTMAWHAGVFAHDVFVFRSSITFFVCCTIFCLSYAFSYRIPYVKGYLEYTSYFIATSAVVVHCVLVLWWKSSLYTQENFVKFAPSVSKLFGMTFDSEDPPDKKDSPIYHFVVLFNELFMGISFQSTILIIYVLFDVLSPTRFFIVSRIQGLNTILGTIPFIYGATQLPETLLPNTATIVCICTISAAGFVGSYPMELRRRGLFFEWLSMKRAVANLLNIRRRAQKAAGSSSALDDIRSNLNQALEILTDMKANSGKFDVAAGVSQALTLVQESLFIFSTCKNLYLTNVDEDLKDESFIKAFNIGGSQARNLLNAESAISSTVGGNSRVGGKFGQGSYTIHREQIG